MDCGELPEYNLRNKQWAAVMGCYWIECPGGQEFDAEIYFDESKERLG
jgi:hypothetical protein